MPVPGTVWAPNTWNVNAWAANTWANAQSAPVGVGGYTVGLTIGPAAILTAGVIYAMPARRCLVHVQQAGGTIQLSNDGVTFADITLDDDEQFESAGVFIRAVTTDAIVTCKA